MFVREKKNKSGTTTVEVVVKENGTNRRIRAVGTSSDAEKIKALRQQGEAWVSGQNDLPDMFESYERAKFAQDTVEIFLDNIENILPNGVQLILNRVFRLIGFDRIDDEILKHLVVARICQPQSKAATVAYLKSHFDEDIEHHKIYRYLDTLYHSQKDKVQEISVSHTRKVLGGKIGLVFYDVTTLYFETDYGDDLRKTGFSKDGKHSQPQIVLGLLVSAGGYPLAYSIHEGNKYEGHTMLPVVEDFVTKFDLKEFVVVADSGLMNKENIADLEKKNYKYILGARIKNEGEEVKNWIFSLAKQDCCFYELGKLPKSRLIVGYSESRAKKDASNREKGIRRLEKEYKNRILTKDKVNKRGYNKFLEISDDIKVTINQAKIKEDERWDGWKGYLTNTDLSAVAVYEEYSGLWQVERAFCITKGTLELRPVFHFTRRRIEAHVCICFVAYKVYKELERILQIANIGLSVDKVLDIAKTINTIRVRLPHTAHSISRTMLISVKQKSIACLFDENFWLDNRLRIE
jgi:transposase